MLIQFAKHNVAKKPPAMKVPIGSEAERGLSASNVPAANSKPMIVDWNDRPDFAPRPIDRQVRGHGGTKTYSAKNDNPIEGETNNCRVDHTDDRDQHQLQNPIASAKHLSGGTGHVRCEGQTINQTINEINQPNGTKQRGKISGRHD